MSYLNNIKKAGSSELFLKVLLSGDDGAGKSTSVIFGSEKPLLVIDPESKADIYGHIIDFDSFNSQDPNEILELTNELLQLQNSGHELPYKSILVDSATVLYKYIVNATIKKVGESEGNPEKYKLEGLEYPIAQKTFYEIINNLKKLNVHLFVTAHVKDNYLEGSFMKKNPNEPVKADVEKRLPYEMHLHIMLRKIGKKYKAERLRSNVLDKNKNHLIPAVIDNFDNNTLISVIHEHAKKDKGFIENKPEIQNVIKTNAHLANLVDQVITSVQALQMSSDEAVSQLQSVTGKSNPHELNESEAEKALAHFNSLYQETSESDQ